MNEGSKQSKVAFLLNTKALITQKSEFLCWSTHILFWTACWLFFVGVLWVFFFNTQYKGLQLPLLVLNYKTLIFVNRLCISFTFCDTRTHWHNATCSLGNQQLEPTLKSWRNSNKSLELCQHRLGINESWSRSYDFQSAVSHRPSRGSKVSQTKLPLFAGCDCLA